MVKDKVLIDKIDSEGKRQGTWKTCNLYWNKKLKDWDRTPKYDCNFMHDVLEGEFVEYK